MNIDNIKLEENSYLVYRKDLQVGDNFLGKTIIKIEDYDDNYVKIIVCSNNYII